MKKTRILVALALVVSIACATVNSGDPVLVRGQQTYLGVRDTCDLLFTLELANKAVIEANAPGTHAKVNELRKSAVKYLPIALNAVRAYEAGKTQPNANNLTLILGILDQLLKDLQASQQNIQTAYTQQLQRKEAARARGERIQEFMVTPDVVISGILAIEQLIQFIMSQKQTAQQSAAWTPEQEAAIDSRWTQLVTSPAWAVTP